MELFCFGVLPPRGMNSLAHLLVILSEYKMQYENDSTVSLKLANSKLILLHVARREIYSLARSGGATPGRARSNDLAGRSTALALALAPPCLALLIALRFGNSRELF